MNETIPQLAFPDASHKQIRTLINRMDDLFLSEKKAHPILKDLITDAKGELTTHEKVLNRPISDPLTAVNKADDATRDGGIRAFMSKVNAAAEDLKPEISTPAKVIRAICLEHGGKGIASMKLAEQTDVTSRLVSRLREPLNWEIITFLGFTSDLDIVENQNKGFEATWKQRTTHNPEAASIPLMKEVRRDLDAILTLFVKNLKWLLERNRSGLTEATIVAIRKNFVELSSDLTAQANAKAAAETKLKGETPIQDK